MDHFKDTHLHGILTLSLVCTVNIWGSVFCNTGGLRLSIWTSVVKSIFWFISFNRDASHVYLPTTSRSVNKIRSLVPVGEIVYFSDECISDTAKPLLRKNHLILRGNEDLTSQLMSVFDPYLDEILIVPVTISWWYYITFLSTSFTYFVTRSCCLKSVLISILDFNIQYLLESNTISILLC